MSNSKKQKCQVFSTKESLQYKTGELSNIDMSTIDGLLGICLS